MNFFSHYIKARIFYVRWHDEDVHFVLDQHAYRKLDFYSDSTQKQQSAGRNIIEEAAHTHKNKDIWYLQISLALIISVNFSASYRDYIYIYQTYSWTTLKKGQLYQNDWWNSRHIYLVYVWKQKHLMSVYNRTQIHIHKKTRGSVGWACVAHLSFCFEET
jgi:hypothetical protein